MKRDIAAVMSVLLLIVFSLMNARFIAGMTESGSRLAERAMELAQEGEWDGALKCAESAKDAWTSKARYLYTVMKHSCVSTGTEKTLALEKCLEERDEEGTVLAAADLMQYMGSIKVNESVRIESVM